MGASTAATPTELKRPCGEAYQRVDGDGGDDVDGEPKGEEVVGGDEGAVDDVGLPGVVVEGCKRGREERE